MFHYANVAGVRVRLAAFPAVHPTKGQAPAPAGVLLFLEPRTILGSNYAY